MVVPDTSAWIEYFRRSGSSTNLALRAVLASDAVVAVTEGIVMELVAGARSSRERRDVLSLMRSFDLLPLHGVSDYEAAGDLYRACRAQGETIRKMTDLLIAIPVIREGAELLHNDADFDAIARHSDLRIYRGGN